MVPARPDCRDQISPVLLCDQGHIVEAAGKGDIIHVEVWALQWLNVDFYFELTCSHCSAARSVDCHISAFYSFDIVPTSSHADGRFGDGEDFKTLADIAIHFPLFLLLGATVLLCQVLN